MVWEFPAVSQSRVEFWKEPQFTKGGMWWFTLAFGFFGLHHLYLRSPQTALMFLIVNFVTLGFPWFYDLIQLSNAGESLESLNKHGLNNHFYPLGVAQGMWKEPEGLMKAFSNFTGIPVSSQPQPQKGGALPDGPPSPTWFFLYSLLIPIAPLAQFIAADTNNAVSRFLDLTIIPLGFLFYFCAFMYDYLILLLYPADLFVAGSKRFFPFTYLGMDIEGHSERLTGISEIKPCPADGFIITMFRISLPIISIVAPGLAQSVKAALDTANKTKEAVVDQGLEKINKATRIAKQASELATLGTLGTLAPMPQVQMPQVQMPQVQQVSFIESTARDTKYLDASGKRFGTMVGGSLPKEPFTPLDYAALGSLGAVIAGGFVLSFNRTKNDPPPNPGRV
jgi:TM2 domain-containing membrane protein YozV